MTLSEVGARASLAGPAASGLDEDSEETPVSGEEDWWLLLCQDFSVFVSLPLIRDFSVLVAEGSFEEGHFQLLPSLFLK